MKILRWAIIACIILVVILAGSWILRGITFSKNNAATYSEIDKAETVVITNEVGKYSFEENVYQNIILIPNGNIETINKVIDSNYSTKQFCYLYDNDFYKAEFDACMQLPTFTFSEIIQNAENVVIDLDAKILIGEIEYSYDNIITSYKEIINSIHQYNSNVDIYVISKLATPWYNQAIYELKFYYQAKDNVKLIYDEVY